MSVEVDRARHGATFGHFRSKMNVALVSRCFRLHAACCWLLAGCKDHSSHTHLYLTYILVTPSTHHVRLEAHLSLPRSSRIKDPEPPKTSQSIEPILLRDLHLSPLPLVDNTTPTYNLSSRYMRRLLTWANELTTRPSDEPLQPPFSLADMPTL